MRDGGFPVDDEDVLETMARMLAAAGETEAASLIRSGRLSGITGTTGTAERTAMSFASRLPLKISWLLAIARQHSKES